MTVWYTRSNGCVHLEILVHVTGDVVVFVYVLLPLWRHYPCMAVYSPRNAVSTWCLWPVIILLQIWCMKLHHAACLRSFDRNYCGRMAPNMAWWRHQMETFSALLALCAGNSPVTGEIPSQMPVTRSIDIFLWSVPWINNHEVGDLRRHRAHCDVIVMVNVYIILPIHSGLQ